MIPGSGVDSVLRRDSGRVLDVVRETYLAHGEGRTVNPPSYFLTMPELPRCRIIALPASGGELAGVKWISSWPANVESGLPRASGVIVLNDLETGYPLTCIEASIISAVRTAASATVAAEALVGAGPRPRRVGLIGAGLIARHVHSVLGAAGWGFEQVGVHDLVEDNAEAFLGYVDTTADAGRGRVFRTAEDLIVSSDLVVFATVASEPHITQPHWFRHNPLVLHVSLRDLAPEVILGAFNVVDDVDHCLRANTSVHLTEQRVGNRDFIAGTLHDVLTGAVCWSREQPCVFSPFGLGVLDLALASLVYRELSAQGRLRPVSGFFHELDRYGR